MAWLARGPAIRTIEFGTTRVFPPIAMRDCTHREMAFSADGKTLAVSEDGGTIRLIDVEAGTEGRRCCVKGRAVPVAFGPGGRTLAAPDEEGTVWLWDLSNAPEPPTRSRHPEPIQSLVFSPDGGLMLTRNDKSNVVRLVDAATGIECSRWEGAATVYYLHAAAFSPDGRVLARPMPDGSILLHATAGLRPGAAVTQAARPAIPLGSAWDALGGTNVIRASAAFQAMVGAGAPAAAFLDGRLRAVPPDERDVDRLAATIRELDHEDFTARDRATNRLLEFGSTIEPALLRVLDAPQSPEVRARIEHVLSRGNDPLRIPAGDPLRRYRAIQVLKRIGSPEAQSVLRSLRDSAPSLRERRAAESALDRSDHR
jgi:hypothetical protein